MLTHNKSFECACEMHGLDAQKTRAIQFKREDKGNYLQKLRDKCE